MNFVINKAIIDDIEKIVDLWKDVINWHATFDETFELNNKGKKQYIDYIKSAIIAENQIVYKASTIDDNNIVGFLFAYISSRELFFKKRVTVHISDIAVHPAYRRKGIGKKLMEELENKFAKEVNASDITLYVHSKNTNAINFYIKEGFNEQMKLMRKKLKT